MDIAAALKLADDLVFLQTGKHLDYVQEAILRGTFKKRTYTQIAKEVYSSSSHVRNVGSDLWKILSEGLGENITKASLKPILETGKFYNYQFAIVRDVTSENITVNKNVNICSKKARSPATPHNPPPTTKQPRIDLSDAPQILTFYDRTPELSTLKQWILDDRTHLITILGLTGSGKSAIALQLIQQIQHQFDCIIWRSLRHSPPLSALQTDLIKFLSNQQFSDPPNPPLSRGGEEIQLPYPRRGEEIQPLSPPLSKGGLGGVIEYLRSQRCLIVLDDVQTIFSSGQLAGNYKPSYENYGAFFKQIAESCHNSCLILLSWEKPREIAALEGGDKNCQTLQLNGLGESAREIFIEKGLLESENWSELIELYKGNPLWLNIVATIIQDLFSGKVSAFLSYQSLVLGDLEYLLHQHFQRLSEAEKQVMFWLANESAAVEISNKPRNLELSPSEFLKAVESLRRRLLIEKVQEGECTLFSVQRAIAEYVKNNIK
ncbi:NB-ARC domain-containing protein [Microcoleus sp. ARI1-B5]|uniref:NB-ARC domain-containing protein n=1 Tax=unclassified Microcoleus TaxID=2642155 RepID=UPI002FD33508